MNEDFNIESAALRVGKGTENVYDEKFWNQLDLVITALDNREARLYVDEKCVEFKKPMVDSGTLGTKGNTQVVVPNLTESYGSSADPPEKEIAICTLKLYPYKIEHTIQFAREDFEDRFTQQAEDMNSFCKGGEAFFKELEKEQIREIQTLKNIHGILTSLEDPNSFEGCIIIARKLFESQFDHQIQQLLYCFPKDTLTKEGTKFWTGSKRAPSALEFDMKDSTHMEFVTSASYLLAETFGIRSTKSMDIFQKVLSNYKPVKFCTKTGRKKWQPQMKKQKN
eukprot:UN24874